MTLLLDGAVADPHTARLSALEAELRQVRRELADAEIEADRAREDANRALSMLRRQLSPLYRALQAVFGELDAAGVADTTTSTSAPSSPDQPRGRGEAVGPRRFTAGDGRVMADVPKYGITVLAHVEQSLSQATVDLASVTAAINGERRLRPAERQHFSRTLAGVISAAETVRLWLDAGAPR